MAKQFDFSPFISRRVPPAGALRLTEPVKYDFGTGFPDPDSLRLRHLAPPLLVPYLATAVAIVVLRESRQDVAAEGASFGGAAAGSEPDDLVSTDRHAGELAAGRVAKR